MSGESTDARRAAGTAAAAGAIDLRKAPVSAPTREDTTPPAFRRLCILRARSRKLLHETAMCHADSTPSVQDDNKRASNGTTRCSGDIMRRSQGITRGAGDTILRDGNDMRQPGRTRAAYCHVTSRCACNRPGNGDSRIGSPHDISRSPHNMHRRGDENARAAA